MGTMMVLVSLLILSVLENHANQFGFQHNHKSHVFRAEPNALPIGRAEIVSVMELPAHNPIVSVLKFNDDARGEADDVHLHKNSDDGGDDTIRRKQNDDNDGNFYDNEGDDDDKEEEEDDNDDNDDKKASKTN